MSKKKPPTYTPTFRRLLGSHCCQNPPRNCHSLRDCQSRSPEKLLLTQRLSPYIKRVDKSYICTTPRRVLPDAACAIITRATRKQIGPKEISPKKCVVSVIWPIGAPLSKRNAFQAEDWHVEGLAFFVWI